MLCCLLAALVVGPLAFIVAPFREGGAAPDCCARPRAWRLGALVALGLLLVATCTFLLFSRVPRLCVFPIGGNTQVLRSF